MAKGINIAIGADTRAYSDAVRRGLIDPTEEAAEALEDFGRSGPRDIERVEDAMQDAQRETEDVKAELKELADEIRNTGRKAKTDFADKYKDAADDTSRAFEQVKDDGFSNAKEVAASFDGSAESIAEGFQGAAAEMFSGFGPLGAAAGLAAAAGLGLALTAINEQQEAAEELKQNLVDAYKAAAEEGRTFIDEAAIIAAATDIYFDPGKYENARREAARIGVDVETYIRAQAGSYEDLVLVIDMAKKAEEQRRDAGANSRQGQADALEEVNALQRIIDENERILELHEQNREAAENVAAAREESERRQQEAIRNTRDADRERWEGLAEARQEAAAQPPVTIRTQLAAPDDETLRRNTQGTFERRPLRVRAEFVTRDGKVIV